MIQRIINAIAFAINKSYPDIPILDIETTQDVNRPAFFIDCNSSTKEPRIYRAGFFKVYSFDVLYDPGVNDPELSCREVEDELTFIFSRLEDLESEYGFRPIDLEFKIVEGTLHALFDVREAIRIEPLNEPLIERFTLASQVE